MKYIKGLHFDTDDFFSDVKINRFFHLNIFIGKNNSGKTFILDKLYNEYSAITNFISCEELLFYFSDRKSGVSKHIQSERKKALQNLFFQFDQTSTKNKKLILRLFKELTDLELEYLQGTINHFVQKSSGGQKFYLDIADIGSAYVTLLALLIQALWNDNPYILIDEPELGLHTDMQKKLFIVFKKISKIAHKQVFITTHSHLFLDKESPMYNFKVKNKDGNGCIEQLETQTDIFVTMYQMLGNSPADLLLPSNYIIVEGKSDKVFLLNIMNRFYKKKIKDKNIIIQTASGDLTNKQINQTFSRVIKLYSVIENNPLYKERCVILVDQQPTNVLKSFKKEYRISNNRLFTLGSIHSYALETSYPHEVIKRIIAKKKVKVRHKNIPSLIKTILKNKSQKKVKWAKLVAQEITFDEIPQIFKDVIETAIKLAY